MIKQAQVAYSSSSKAENNPAVVAMNPIPFWQMTMIVLLQVAECVNINVLFPFIAFMVEDFGFTGRQVGRFLLIFGCCVDIFI